MKSSNIRYLSGLDHLRGFAALLIFFYHALHVYSLMPRAADYLSLWVFTKNPLYALIEEGHTALALFMVLSGFVFSVGADGCEVAYWPFMRNRFLRIYPLFLLMLLVGIAAHPGRYSLLGLLQSLLFQANFGASLDVSPFSSMFWAIGVEFQFYLIFPFLHRFLQRGGVGYGLLLITLVALLRYGALLVGSSNARDIQHWHLIGRLDQFVLGMLAARVYLRIAERRLRWGRLTALAWMGVIGALVAFNELGGWPSLARWKVLWPIAEAALWALVIITYVPFAARFPAWLSAPLARLGTYSYSLYVLHFPLLYAVPRLVHFQLGAHPNRYAILYALGWVLPPLLVVAALCYHVVEEPFLRMRVKYLREALAEDKGGAPAARVGAPGGRMEP